MKNPANWRAEGLLCWYCGDPAFGFDHQLPKSKYPGLKNNRVAACKECNSAKADRTVEEFEIAIQQWNSHLRSQLDNKKRRLLKKLEPHNFVFFARRSPDNLIRSLPITKRRSGLESGLLRRRKEGSIVASHQECHDFDFQWRDRLAD